MKKLKQLVLVQCLVMSWSPIIAGNSALAGAANTGSGPGDTESVLELEDAVTSDSDTAHASSLGDEVLVKVRLKSYATESLHMSLTDGASVSYDATIFVVLEPTQYRGKELWIYHHKPKPVDSSWRSECEIFELTVYERTLADDDFEAFSDTLSLQSVKK